MFVKIDANIIYRTWKIRICFSSVVGRVMVQVAGLSPRRPGFMSRSVYVELVVDKVAPRQVFL
jgi:hypothetical protein